ncbi:MAG TPA: hypothetical protein VGP63_12520 [Planctomycetaceae bacterium]|jgi:hypothetical protein|nr:hypothetical protein [Planctomycetaceae bacterium]
MSDEPKKRRSWGWIGWALVAAFVLYPLSFGPAAWIFRETDSPEVADTIITIYAPLQRFCGLSKSATAALNWYMVLWRDYD